MCEGTITYQTCVIRYRPPGGGSYMIVHQPMPETVASLAGFDYMGLLSSMSVTSLSYQKFKNNLDIKILPVPDGEPVLYSVSAFPSADA